jgi:hypothetical protein
MLVRFIGDKMIINFRDGLKKEIKYLNSFFVGNARFGLYEHRYIYKNGSNHGWFKELKCSVCERFFSVRGITQHVIGHVRCSDLKHMKLLLRMYPKTGRDILNKYVKKHNESLLKLNSILGEK